MIGRPPAGPRPTWRRSPPGPGGEDYPSIGGSIGSTCVDATTPPSRVYPRVADAQDRRFPDFGRYRTWVDLPCRYLKAAGIRDTDAYRGPWRQTTHARVLVIGTRWDPATRTATPARTPGSSRTPPSVTHEGWGHVAVDKSACALAVTSAYLTDPTQPRADRTCPTDVVPFTVAAPQKSKAVSECRPRCRCSGADFPAATADLRRAGAATQPGQNGILR